MHAIVIWGMVFYEYTIAVIRLTMLLLMLIVLIPCMCALCCRGQSISYYVGVRLFRDYASEEEAQIAGSVWKIETTVGAEVEEEDVLMILESMKMEIPVEAPCAGRVSEIRVAEGDAIEEGAILAVIE